MKPYPRFVFHHEHALSRSRDLPRVAPSAETAGDGGQTQTVSVKIISRGGGGGNF